MKFGEVKTYVLELTYEDAKDLYYYFNDTFGDANTSKEYKNKADMLYAYLAEAVT